MLTVRRWVLTPCSKIFSRSASGTPRSPVGDLYYHTSSPSSLVKKLDGIVAMQTRPQTRYPADSRRWRRTRAIQPSGSWDAAGRRGTITILSPSSRARAELCQNSPCHLTTVAFKGAATITAAAVRDSPCTISF
ncbi:hypothetical protein KCP74_23420 [Salmonella enterica subsp. enterica]|nr:hypothetical protein KCP74_23420 [Salmonella enterica subsp. enterica]